MQIHLFYHRFVSLVNYPWYLIVRLNASCYFISIKYISKEKSTENFGVCVDIYVDLVWLVLIYDQLSNIVSCSILCYQCRADDHKILHRFLF